MAQLALGIVNTGQTLSVVAAGRSYRQSGLKICRTYTLNTDSQDNSDRDQEIASKLSELMKQEKLSKARVSFGLESEAIMISLLEMPPVSQEDIRQILEFELDSHLPVDPETITFDAKILGSRSGVNSQVALVATDKNHLDRFQHISAAADLSLDAISPVSMSVVNTALRIWKPVTDAKINIFLIATDHGYEVVIAGNGRYLASRKVHADNPWVTENDSVDGDTSVSHSDIPASIQQTMRLALIMCNRSSALKDIEEITCIGNVDNDVLSALKDQMPATIFSMFQVAKLIDPSMPYSEIAAACLAMELHEDDQFINLVPPELRPVRRDFGRVLTGAAAGLLVAAMVLVGANNYWQTDLKYLTADAQISALQGRVDQITEINNRFASSQEAKRFFMTKSAAYPSQLEILREVTLLLPSEDSEDAKKVWLENYEVEDNELTIRGDSDSPEGLLTLLEESSLFEKVKFDGTVSGTRFTIKANISKLSDGDETAEGDGDDGEESSKSGNATPGPTPTTQEATPAENEANDDHEGDDHGEETRVRGPAFPRTKLTEPSETAETSAEEPESGNHTESLTPEEQAEIDETTRQEDMEAMKQNLFDFIKERKDSGELEASQSKEYEEQDPDEAAANFLEFLKAAADSNEGEN